MTVHSRLRRIQHMDVTDEAQVQAVITATMEQFGKLDVLYNNAGGSRTDGRIRDIRLEDSGKP